MYRTYSIAFLMLIGVLGCSGSDTTVASIASPSEHRPADGPTEVVIVGTQHLITDMPAGFTPGHLRALLANIEPDIILTEEAMNVRGGASTAPYECANVTLPWAAEHQVEVIPVGWYSPGYAKLVDQMVQRFAASGNSERYELIERRFQQESGAMVTSCETMNGKAYNKLWRDYHDRLHQLAGSDTPWEQWNAKVVDNIRKACQTHPGKRIAVVFGGAHTYYFADQLAADSQLKVIPTDRYLPITSEQLAENTTPLDYVKAMRPLNLAAISHVQLDHVGRQLDHVKGVPSLAGDYNLFYGKYLMHAGKLNEAVSAFDAVISAAGESISKFDETNRLIDGARFGAVIALSQAGQNEYARQRLQAILGDQASNMR